MAWQIFTFIFPAPKRPLSGQTLLPPLSPPYNHYSDSITCHCIWLCHFLNLKQKEYTVCILFVTGFLLLHVAAIFLMLKLAHCWPVGAILNRILCVPKNPIHLWKLPCFLAQDSIRLILYLACLSPRISYFPQGFLLAFNGC